MKNHEFRPTRITSFPEENVVNLNCGRGRGRGHGRGRDRRRGINNYYLRDGRSYNNPKFKRTTRNDDQ